MRLRDRIRLAKIRREEERAAKVVRPVEHPIEHELRRTRSIGDLERLAGIGSSREDRAAFWLPFSALPARETLDAGCAELRRRVRLTAGAPMPAAG
jgi:hypothetical protein